MPPYPLFLLPQIGAGDIEAFARSGVRVIISNRPQEEDGVALSDADMATACQAAGIDYVAAPVRGAPSPDVVRAVADRLKTLPEGAGVVLYCRSGWRSAVTWALAEREIGRLPDHALKQAAARWGHDLSRHPAFSD